MTKPTKYERETIINFNEAEDVASIYTFNTSLKKRLSNYSKEYPDLCWLKNKSEYGDVTYEIKKRRLSVRLLPPYSDDRRIVAMNNLKNTGYVTYRPLTHK